MHLSDLCCNILDFARPSDDTRMATSRKIHQTEGCRGTKVLIFIRFYNLMLFKTDQSPYKIQLQGYITFYPRLFFFLFFLLSFFPFLSGALYTMFYPMQTSKLTRARLNVEIPSAAEIRIRHQILTLVMSYRSDKLRVDTHTRMHTHRRTQATTLPEGQNWPRVITSFL